MAGNQAQRNAEHFKRYAALKAKRDALAAQLAEAQQALREIAELTEDCDELSGGWLVGEKARAALAVSPGEPDVEIDPNCGCPVDGVHKFSCRFAGEPECETDSGGTAEAVPGSGEGQA